MLINAHNYSYTKRYRAYWTNFMQMSDLPAPSPRPKPNECMVGNRNIIQYEACSRLNVRPIGASWKNGKSTSSRPLLVDDPDFEQPQHLLPSEAEAFHGMPVGCTAGHGATADQRLTTIGNGWDLNVVIITMSHTQLCKDAAIAKTMVTMHASLQFEDVATVLMQLEPEVRQHHLQLLQKYYAAIEPTCANARSLLVPPQNVNHSSAAAHQPTCADARSLLVPPQNVNHSSTAAHQPTCADARSLNLLVPP